MGISQNCRYSEAADCEACPFTPAPSLYKRSELFLRPLKASTADALLEAGRSSGRMDVQHDLAQVHNY